MNTLLRKTFRPKTYTMVRHFELTEQEEKIVELFRSVDARTHTGECIRNIFLDYSIDKVRQTINDLRSQMDEHPNTMYRILGYELFEVLKELGQ